MDQTQLQILLTLKDEMSASFDRAAKNIGKSADDAKNKIGFLSTDLTKFTRVLAGGAIAAGGLAVAFGIDAVKSFSEAQVSLARIDATLKSMGPAALRSRDAILKSAEAAVKLGFDDEAAAESITRFYQATNDLTKAQDLNNLAMDLARAKNIDLATATQLVNQVLSGNGKALKQYQIDLDETKTPLEALGQLQEKVAGQAQGFAETFPGQLLILKESWSNVKDEIGKVLVDALAPLVKQFSDWLTNPETQKKFKEWTAEFRLWAEVVIPVLIDTFKMWWGWIDAIVTRFTDLIDSINEFRKAAKDVKKDIDSAGGIGGYVKGVAKELALKALPGRASGGAVSGGMPYIVGERGPELFMPSGNGSIIPNNQLGGSGITVNLSGNFYGTDQETARKFADSIAKLLGQQIKIRSI